MLNFLQDSNLLLVFSLVFLRVTGLMFTAPFFGSSAIDPRLKVFLSVIVALAIFNAHEDFNITLVDINTALLVLIMLKELLIGVATGLLGQFLFIAVQFGGQIMGFQMGFGVVNVLDPQTNTQISIIAQFQNIVMILIFLTIGGHRIFLEAVSKCFEMVPLGTFVFPVESYFFIVSTFSEIFFIALKIIAPVFVTLFVTHTVMGIIARLVPQINILIVGFPLQIAAGLAVLILSMSYFYNVFELVMYDYFKNLLTLFHMLGA